MKYLNTFNESVDKEEEIKYHLDMIKDLFQDVIDENNLDEYARYDIGGVYRIFKTDVYDPSGGSGNRIRVWALFIGNSEEKRKIINDIKNSKEVEYFEERLKSLGYIIHKDEVEWYCIDIDYSKA